MADIGVVIVSYNLHEDCLTSLADAIKQTTHSVEVVIVDNDSPQPNIKELVEKRLPSAKLFLRGENHGFGRSMNYGAKQVDAKYYFLLNPDTRLTDPDVLNKLYDYAEAHPSVGIVAPKISNMDGTRQDTCRRFPAWYQPLVQRTPLGETDFGKKYTEHFLMHDFDQMTERPVEQVQGSALFLSKDTWNKLDGFDERFWLYFEDIDLCRRTWLLGRPVMYVPTITLQHAYGRASAKIKNPVMNILKSRAARGHIVSWVKYLWKWKGRKEAKVE